MSNIKYNWDAIAEHYKSGVPTKDICDKYKLTYSQLQNFARNNKIKRPNNFKRKIVNFKVWNNRKTIHLIELINKGLPQKIIAEKLSLSIGSVNTQASRIKVKSKYNSKIKNMFFDLEQADAIRNKYYLGIWIDKTHSSIANFLNCNISIISNILNYAKYTSHLNLTVEQIKSLYKKMKRNRAELREDLMV